MQADDGAPDDQKIGHEDDEPRETKAASQPSAAKETDDWGQFYSMPPKWKRDEAAERDARVKIKLTDENIGHKLASLLRYHLEDHDGISTDEDGWVQVSDIIAHADEAGLHGCTAADLIRVAETNEHDTRGKRFESDGAGRIMAKYRHPPKDGRNRRSDRDGRSSRESRSRGGYNGWWSNGQEDYGKWSDGWHDRGGDSWSQWKTEKPGFSPSPDKIVKDRSWESAAKSSQVDKPSGDAVAHSKCGSTQPDAVSASVAICEWEQWFTPEDMEMYYYSTVTEECFFPGDASDIEEKGWCRYVDDAEGEKQGKIYWWHEATSRSFYEEDAVGDADA
jgi:hypothetical protein